VIRQGGYAVLGLMAQYELSNQLSLRLNVANVADKKYLTSLYWSQGYYAAPRNASATLTWKY
jgi:outer membrane receptor for ferric coprogen and ferric-rhodotorulic acid